MTGRRLIEKLALYVSQPSLHSIRAQNWSANNSKRIVQIFELFWSYGWT